MGQAGSLALSTEQATVSFLQEDSPENDAKSGRLHPVDMDPLARDFSDLLASKKHSDVTFVVTKDGKERFHAHKALLACRSKVFEAMFFSHFAESKSEEDIIVPDCTPHAFRILLNAVYTDQAVLDYGTVLDVIYCAKKYQVHSLVEMCFAFMEDKVTPESACRMLESAPYLLDNWRYAIEFIEKNASEVLDSRGFLNLSHDSLLRVVKSDNLSVSELELFESCLRWAKKEVDRRQMRGGPTSQNLMEVLKHILPHIRFPTMTSEELATYVSPTEVLRKDQLLSVFVYLGTEETPEEKKPLVPFPTLPRRRHRDEWRLHKLQKCDYINLSDEDMKATLITKTGHGWVNGSKIFQRGKHAWRTHIETLSGNQWIFIGIIGAGQPSSTSETLSFANDSCWGFSSSDQKYAGGVQRRKKLRYHQGHPSVDWRAGHRIDTLLDLDNNELKFYNLTTRQELILTKLPSGQRWVSHYNLHTIGNAFKVETIQPSEYSLK